MRDSVDACRVDGGEGGRSFIAGSTNSLLFQKRGRRPVLRLRMMMYAIASVMRALAIPTMRPMTTPKTIGDLLLEDDAEGCEDIGVEDILGLATMRDPPGSIESSVYTM